MALAPEFNGLRAEMREGFGEMREGLNEVRREIGGVRDEVRQLREGAVGIGRMTALETRVTDLERKS